MKYLIEFDYNGFGVSKACEHENSRMGDYNQGNFFIEVSENEYNDLTPASKIYNFETQALENRTVGDIQITKEAIKPDGIDSSIASINTNIPIVVFDIMGQNFEVETVNGVAECIITMVIEESIYISVNMRELFCPKRIIKPLLI